MTESEDDIEEFKRLALIMNKRGHAGMFARENAEDLKNVELLNAREWCRSVEAEFGLSIGCVCGNPNDPPDCFAYHGKQLISIELTELVDGVIISNIQKSRKAGGPISAFGGKHFDDAQWDRRRLTDELTDRIQAKEKNYSERNLAVDVLIIYTDEPWLLRKDVEDWLAGAKFAGHNSIKNAFLLMSYDPSNPEH